MIDWHEIIQNILDENLGFMSGKKIKEAAREYPKYFFVDYYCLTEGDLPEAKEEAMTRPFDHLEERNLIEYKSIHQVLNEKTFRLYAARALYLEGEEENSYQGKMTLTILTSHKPQTLLGMPEYKIEKINDWKYISHWLKDLKIYILVQKEMRKKQEGDALALLQILEGEKEKQFECWKAILSQNLKKVDIIRKVIEKIGKETYMNLLLEARNQGKIEGKMEGEREGQIKGQIKGKMEGLEAILDIKFGDQGLACMEKIRSIHDLEKLQQVFLLAKNSLSLKEFQEMLPSYLV